MIWQFAITIIFLSNKLNPWNLYLVKELCKFFISKASLCDSNCKTPSPLLFGQTYHVPGCFGGCFGIDISPSPKSMFSILVNLCDDCLVKLEGAEVESGAML
jgi:hypothetical protein